NPETKCIYFQSPGFSAEIAMKGLTKMKDLRFIDIRLVKYHSPGFSAQLWPWELDKVSEYLPCSLQFMRWWGFPFSTLPNTFQGKYIVELKIYKSKIVEDGEEKVLHSLRFLTIDTSKLRTFDLRLAPNLEQLLFTDVMISTTNAYRKSKARMSSLQLFNVEDHSPREYSES
ncbi:hypothetical protein Tco_0101946, partial [Tanacetum coccineum]